MFIVAVTGWRAHSDREFIYRNLDAMRAHLGDIFVRVGDADGADNIARKWCEGKGVEHQVYYARRYPSGALMPGAGPERNRKMLTQRPVPDGYSFSWRQHLADLLMAFPEPYAAIRTPGSGSWGCINEAFLLGIEINIPSIHVKGKSDNAN